jgi:hypothetical protein
MKTSVPHAVEQDDMISFISGLIITGAGIGGVWYCRPRDGQVQWFAVAPVLEWLIPIGIVATLGFGFALAASAFG